MQDKLGYHFFLNYKRWKQPKNGGIIIAILYFHCSYFFKSNLSCPLYMKKQKQNTKQINYKTKRESSRIGLDNYKRKHFYPCTNNR